MSGPVQQEMERLLSQAFSPTRLEVINDSAKHAGHSGDDGSGESHFTESPTLTLLLMSSGIVTAIPLLFFAGAAHRLRLSTIGFLMYINPTLQFCLALLVFDEPLSQPRLFSFIIIWLALGLYSWSAWRGRALLQAA